MGDQLGGYQLLYMKVTQGAVWQKIYRKFNVWTNGHVSPPSPPATTHPSYTYTQKHAAIPYMTIASFYAEKQEDKDTSQPMFIKIILKICIHRIGQ